MSADHVYRLDFGDVVDRHLESGAACTVVTSEVPLAEAGDHATVEVETAAGWSGSSTSRTTPTPASWPAEVFAYDPAVLVETLELLHRELGPEAEAGDTGLGDFGEHLLPHLVEHHEPVVAHALPGYWRDVGQPHHYLRAHLDVLTDGAGVLGDADWPILTHQPQRPPARILRRRRRRRQPDQPGQRGGRHRAAQRGRAGRRGRGRRRGGRERGVRRHRRPCGRGRDAHGGRLRVRDRAGTPSWGRRRPTSTIPEQVTLVGRGSRVGDGVRVPAGARFEPGTTRLTWADALHPVRGMPSRPASSQWNDPPLYEGVTRAEVPLDHPRRARDRVPRLQVPARRQAPRLTSPPARPSRRARHGRRTRRPCPASSW